MSRRFVAVVAPGCVLVGSAPAPVAAVPYAAATSTRVGADLAARIAALTAPYSSPTPPGPSATLSDVRAAAEVSRQVTTLLSSAGDRRGFRGEAGQLRRVSAHCGRYRRHCGAHRGAHAVGIRRRSRAVVGGGGNSGRARRPRESSAHRRLGVFVDFFRQRAWPRACRIARCFAGCRAVSVAISGCGHCA